jgi:C4-dicarboxylate-specific signal transduction histidine kinase
MNIVIEISGAQRGLLVLERDGSYCIEAEGEASKGSTELLGGTDYTKSDKLSQAVVSYVRRTQRDIVLGNALEEGLFTEDSYVKKNMVKSLLCAPIISQGSIKGLLYLENNLTGGAFTEERVELVRLIASQAAISLENARLYQALLEDIERRGAVEEELRNSEEMARSLLDALRDSLVLIDTGGRILSLNGTTAEKLRRPMKDIVGREYWSLLPPGMAVRRKTLVERSMRTVKAIRAVEELEGRVSDTVILPVVDSSGKVLRIAILERDITEQRRVEEQAKAQEIHLMRSDRLAMMGELAAGVAHEINNPNHSILLNTGLLLKAYPDILRILDEYGDELTGVRIGGLEYEQFKETFRDSIDRINDCARRIGTIVKEMKSFARPEPEELSEEVDINVTVQSAILLGTPFIKGATDNLSVQLEENLPRIRGNHQKLEQLLLNLIQNACQSLSDRDSGIFVSTRRDEKKHAVVIEVRDEGSGMSRKILAQLTEPFFTTKREIGGTGLGLSISSRIVDEHHGTMRFQSKSGAGTTVTVTLPEGEIP